MQSTIIKILTKCDRCDLVTVACVLLDFIVLVCDSITTHAALGLGLKLAFSMPRDLESVFRKG